MHVGVFGHRVAEEGAQAVHARGTDAHPVVIGQQYGYFLLLQGLRQCTCDPVGTDDQHAATVRFGYAEPLRQAARGGALQYDRADDEQEGQWHQLFGSGHALLFQLQGEQCRYGGSHDATWRDPGDQRAFAPG